MSNTAREWCGRHSCVGRPSGFEEPGSLRCWAFLFADFVLIPDTDTRDVIQLCVKEGIPIYKGKIDRSLLSAVMKAKGIQLPKTQVAAV